jgi:nucleotide-binding universal stress UspA family protein
MSSTHAIASILVHLDGSPRAAVRLRLAHSLADIHHATLSAVFAVASRYARLAMPLVGGAASAPGPAEIDMAHRDNAKALFESTVSKGTASSSWHELSGEAPIPGFVQRALLSDLVVLGQRDPVDEAAFDIPADFVESVIIDSGRPVLVVPYAGEARADPHTVLVAWNGTRESAHALTAALPLLARARKIYLACSAANIVDTHHAFTQVRQYLSAHRIGPVEDQPSIDAGNAGSDLLSLASDAGAELLVMGCYGHSRARELVLGGASRVVLQSMTLPVLMAH